MKNVELNESVVKRIIIDGFKTGNQTSLCPVCNGNGFTREYERVSLRDSEMVTEDCRACNGDRVVTIEITLRKVVPPVK